MRVGRTSATAKKPTDAVSASVSVPSDALGVTIGIPSLTLLLPGQVLILAQETLSRHRQQSPQSCTSGRSLLRRSTLHHNRTPAIRLSCNHWCTKDFPCPSAVQTPSVHTKKAQLCCSMLSRSAPCCNSLRFLLMSFDDSTRGLVVFTFSLLPPSQVWSVHCRLGSNCESFFDSCSVGIDSPCGGGAVLSLST